MGFGLCALVLGHSVIGQSNDLASKVNLFIETTPKGVASQYEYMRRLSYAVITFFREQLPPWMIKAGLDMDSLDRVRYLYFEVLARLTTSRDSTRDTTATFSTTRPVSASCTIAGQAAYVHQPSQSNTT